MNDKINILEEKIDKIQAKVDLQEVYLIYKKYFENLILKILKLHLQSNRAMITSVNIIHNISIFNIVF